MQQPQKVQIKMDKTYDTSSSIYLDETGSGRPREIYSKQAIHTPAPSDSPDGSESGFFDDVYKPYVTPPSPFESSTHDQNKRLEAINPYAQSLWYTFRGNDSTEIEKYKKVPVCCVPEPSKVRQSGLLPSLMAKLEPVDSHLSREREECVDRQMEEQVLKPLNTPPPYELIRIQSKMVKKLKCLLEIADKFSLYVREHKILISSKVKLYLFSNVETLLIIHGNFFDTVLNKTGKSDIEEIIYDYLQRLSHVYPSYLSVCNIREQFTKLILKIPKFSLFVGAGSNREINNDLYELIVSPSKDFQELLKYLDEYIGASSPRIKVLISKFMQYYGHSKRLELKDGGSEPLYLDVPDGWKRCNKLVWKEIGGMSTEKQLAYFLKFQIKAEFDDYGKIIRLVKFQLDQISKLAVVNSFISKQFVKFHTQLPDTGPPNSHGSRSSYDFGAHIRHVEQQNRQVYLLVEAFSGFVGKDNYRKTETLIKRVCHAAKKIYASNDASTATEDQYLIDQIFEIYRFKLLFEEKLYLTWMKFNHFFKAYVKVMNSHTESPIAGSTDDIILSFKMNERLQKRNIQIEEDQLAVYNQELSRVCAKGRLMKRFFM